MTFQDHHSSPGHNLDENREVPIKTVLVVRSGFGERLVLTLCLQEAKRASGATFIVKFGFRAKKNESAAKDLISIC